ncbi:MAG: hypothetical protein ACHQD9_07195, partial [Chitinophagales bacterium]
MFRILQATIFLFCICVDCVAQNQNNIWYFGTHAGIDFNGPTPVSLSNGMLDCLEGCSSVCDFQGNLLFYTDGITAFDRNHDTMPNGTGLMGGASGTQAAMIVALPGSCSTFYIFTTGDHISNQDFRYSIVDMTLNGGYGDVVSGSKNILITSPVRENLTAVPHSNGTDFWIITHKLDGNKFKAYQLSASGLNMTPVSSAAGPLSSFNSIIGPLKASHHGTNLAMAFTFDAPYALYLFDFNSSTGKVSNAVDLLSYIPNGGGCYGLDFSPNDSLLYVATTWNNNELDQLDLHNNYSNTQLASYGFQNYTYGMLQLAPDGKIYMAHNLQDFLDVVNNPNVAGVGAGYESPGITLAPGTICQLGLPNFVPNYLYATLNPSDFTFHDSCSSLPDTFQAVINATYDSLLWNFGDPGSGNTDTSSSLNPIHEFTADGTFTVNLYVFKPCTIDTVSKNIFIPPPLGLFEDTTICLDDTIQLSTGFGYQNFQWSPAGFHISCDTCPSPLVDPDLIVNYIVTATYGYCTVSDTFHIGLIPAFVNAMPDTTLCLGESVLLHADNGDSFLWQPSASLNCDTCA